MIININHEFSLKIFINESLDYIQNKNQNKYGIFLSY